jgi:hypothetical protein
MPQVGFEHTTSVLEQTKRVHALDRAATVTGISFVTTQNLVRILRNTFLLTESHILLYLRCFHFAFSP